MFFIKILFTVLKNIFNMACPFLAKQGKSTENCQDPDEFLFEDGYPITQTSPFQNLIDYCKPADLIDNRKQFIQYPLYLKNTLFQPDHSKNLRRCEFMEKLIALDDFKKAGNKLYHTKEYEKALECYEKGYGAFKYLEFKTEEGLKFKTIIDNAINLVAPQPKEINEDKITKAAMVTILLDLSAAMIPLRHYNEAVYALSEALEYDPDNASLYAKRSQARFHNLASDDNELNLALEDAKTAAHLSEKFSNLIEKVEAKIRERKSEELNLVKEILTSLSRHGVGETEEVSDEMEFEQKVINRMMQKYEEMLKFYQEGNKYHQRINIRKELAEVQPIYYKMNKISRLTVENPVLGNALKEAGFDVNDKKVIAAVESIKRFKISMAFSGGKFNDQLLNFCIEKCSEEDRAKRAAKLEEQPKQGWNWLYTIIGIILITALAWVLKKYIKFN
ncbi:unnamed protein product [Blepharisma stoltei]|uniref:Uncharacterized protein n=1 Tax=Blepharisma stoltei TaxID=1481888 RepID=A0AAU9K3C2_9CILI|nr:unnamed protein product [Blepharisma stoltei]